MPSIDLCDLEGFKEYATISANTDDPLLTRMITAASRFMLSDMNRPNGMQVQTIDERWDGTGSALHAVDSIPLRSVASLTVGTTTIPASDYSKPGYVADTKMDRIVLIGYCFTRGLMNCHATYSFGYDVIPEDVEQACMELVLLKYKRKKHIDVMSEQLPQGGGTVMFSTKDVTADIRNVIEQYTVRI